MFLAPVLLLFSFFMPAKASSGTTGTATRKITIPWFAFGFIAVIGFNTLGLLPAKLVDAINYFDTFLLTMAMTALGMETTFDKFKQSGFKPFLLALILFIWLVFGGYAIVKLF